MERPLVEVKLPRSKIKAKVVAYFLYKEAKAIEASRFEGAELEYTGGETQIRKVSVNYLQYEQDALLFNGVKELISPEGKSLDISKDTFESLPEPDIKVLLLHLHKAQVGDTESEKKNS